MNIINPTTLQAFSVCSPKGTQILKQYIKTYKSGGAKYGLTPLIKKKVLVELKSHKRDKLLKHPEFKKGFLLNNGGCQLQKYRLFEVVKPFRAFRLCSYYNKTSPDFCSNGEWFSLSPTPKNSFMGKIQDKFVVCPEWNDFDLQLEVEVSPNDSEHNIVVICRGEEATCNLNLKTIPKSNTLQLYIPKESTGLRPKITIKNKKRLVMNYK